jgi:hypothetical protein
MTPEDYDVEACAPGDLSEADLVTCFAIIRSGEAVNPATMRADLPRSLVLVLARHGNRIVGVGAIKPVRPYTSKIATRSGVPFDPKTPELGYVAVDTGHRGHQLSHRIVAKLLSKHQGPLFATTSVEPMKRTLAKAGFVKQEHEWDGRTGKLSLWLRE